MNEIKLPTLDPKLVEAAFTNMRRNGEKMAEQTAAGLVQLREQGAAIGRLMASTLASRQHRPICTCPWPHDELAKREWPHVPLTLARAYAEEYVLTGKRP